MEGSEIGEGEALINSWFLSLWPPLCNPCARGCRPGNGAMRGEQPSEPSHSHPISHPTWPRSLSSPPEERRKRPSVRMSSTDKRDRLAALALFCLFMPDWFCHCRENKTGVSSFRDFYLVSALGLGLGSSARRRRLRLLVVLNVVIVNTVRRAIN